jgi:hypothetical protein
MCGHTFQRPGAATGARTATRARSRARSVLNWVVLLTASPPHGTPTGLPPDPQDQILRRDQEISRLGSRAGTDTEVLAMRARNDANESMILQLNDAVRAGSGLDGTGDPGGGGLGGGGPPARSVVISGRGG